VIIVHISINFILSVILLIVLGTLLLRPITTLQHSAALYHTSPNYTSLHFTTLIDTSSHLHFTTLSFSFVHLHFLSFYFTSHHITSHHITSHHITSLDTVQISFPKLISKKETPFTALKNFSPFHFTSLFILFYSFVKYRVRQKYLTILQNNC
jgi:hypothetical protein